MKLEPKLFDRVEQVVALTFYAFLVYRIWPEDLSAGALAPALILLSEGMIILFLLIRRHTSDISLRPQDWIVAFVATVAPLMIVKAPEPSNLAVGATLLLLGMLIQAAAKLSLRRSFGLVAANRGVKTSGAYRYVRHPMYLGYMVSHVGFFLMSPILINLIVYSVAWSCFILRIEYEERVLTQDSAYQDFKARVRHKILPAIY